MEIERNNKICLICIGESQTGKSSFINTLCNEYKAQIGEFCSGESCTVETRPYGPIITRTGKEVLIIDTKGDNDNRAVYMETEESKMTKLQELLTSLMERISNFSPDKIYIVVTESLQGDTCQLNRNFDKIHQILGDKCISSALLLATKYNPTSLQKNKKESFQVDKRLQTLKDQILLIQSKIHHEIPIVKFHTQLWGEAKEYIDAEPEQYMKQQEDELFYTMQDKLTSFPAVIFKEYKVWCDKMIKELHQTEGIGIRRYIEQTVEYEDGVQTIQVPRDRHFLGFIKTGTTMETITIPTKKPVTKNTEKEIEVQAEDDVRKIFFTDPNYKKLRHDKINELFDKYYKK